MPTNASEPVREHGDGVRRGWRVRSHQKWLRKWWWCAARASHGPRPATAGLCQSWWTKSCRTLSSRWRKWWWCAARASHGPRPATAGLCQSWWTKSCRTLSSRWRRFVDMNDQWTFQCETKKRHPLRDETSTDETTPKPDRPRPHLGRNRVIAYGPVTFPHSGVSRMSASVRLMIQGHSARRASSRVRQSHQLIKISEIKSEPYTVIQST